MKLAAATILLIATGCAPRDNYQPAPAGSFLKSFGQNVSNQAQEKQRAQLWRQYQPPPPVYRQPLYEQPKRSYQCTTYGPYMDCY